MRIRHLLDTGWASLGAHLFGARRPLAVWIDVTNRCPAGCAYCELSRTGKRDMPREALLRLLDELREAGCIRLHLTGGDPLMRDDIGEVIARGKSHGFLVTLSIREHLVRERIEDLKMADVVFLSFEGPREAHDALKGRGSYEKLIDAFELLHSRGVKFLTTTTLTKLNRDAVPFILRTAREYGFTANIQCLHYPYASAGPSGFLDRHPLADLLLSGEEHREIGRRLLQFRGEGEPVATSPRCLSYIFIDWPDHHKVFLREPHDRRVRCWAGRLFCFIDVEGVVYPCGGTVERQERERYLNAIDVGFERAFRHLRPSACRACLQACHVEMNLLFSWDMATIAHWTRQLAGGGEGRPMRGISP